MDALCSCGSLDGGWWFGVLRWVALVAVAWLVSVVCLCVCWCFGCFVGCVVLHICDLLFVLCDACACGLLFVGLAVGLLAGIAGLLWC